MWTELYEKTKLWMSERRPQEFIIQTLSNQREMKTTYSGTYDLVTMLKFLEGKAAEEQAISNGEILCEGGLFSSICQLGG